MSMMGAPEAASASAAFRRGANHSAAETPMNWRRVKGVKRCVPMAGAIQKSVLDSPALQHERRTVACCSNLFSVSVNGRFFFMISPMKLRSTVGAIILLLLSIPIPAAEPEVSERDLPRVPPTEPDQALSSFQIKKGFRIELVAAEPLVVDPIAMAFDKNGRLFVVEMRDYPERRNQTPHLGRIRMLEDTDGDGRFDRSTVYVDNLPWPTAVICWRGGIFVGATPDILYCKDTNGDGVAEVREVVFTGLASDYAPYEVNKLNVQALFNGFTWGLDNRIHAANGGDGGTVHLVHSEFTRAWQEQAGINPKSEIRNPKSLDL